MSARQDLEVTQVDAKCPARNKLARAAFIRDAGVRLLERLVTTSHIERIAREDIDGVVERLEALAKVMDSAFLLPGTNVRMGFDAILGLIPVRRFRAI